MIGTPEPSVELRLAQQSAWNVRWIAQLQDGARVECVLYRDDTLCVSSQVGCAVGCPFCASGANGSSRPLTFDELAGQVQAVQALGHRPARVTVSGVGEPLHNHLAVQRFLAFCRDERLAMSLTTSGGPTARLREWLHAPHNGLTLSIHAGSEATRARLVPHAPSLAALSEVLREHWPRMTQRRRKKTALAYLVLTGVNDSDGEVDAFRDFAREFPARVHLYAYNAVPNTAYRSTERSRFEAIYARLTAAGLRVHMSSQARIEANGGCGTLIARHPNRPLHGNALAR